MKKTQGSKNELESIQHRLRNMKKLEVKKVLKKSHTGLTAHATHTDLDSGYENVERGARQATLDSWVARPMKH
eukprot:3365233-Heterocapsa_arctica.AAC.1